MLTTRQGTVSVLCALSRKTHFDCRMCFFTAEGMNNLQRFLQDLNCSFGSCGVNAWFQSKELPEFLHQLNTTQRLPVKKAAQIVGQQPASSIRVLSQDLQVSRAKNVPNYVF